MYAHCNTHLLRRFKKVAYEENWVPCSDSEDNDPQDDPMDDDEDLEWNNNQLKHTLFPLVIRSQGMQGIYTL